MVVKNVQIIRKYRKAKWYKEIKKTRIRQIKKDGYPFISRFNNRVESELIFSLYILLKDS